MHPIERKLRVEICPYLITGKRLNKWTPYRVYIAYSYLGEVFVLLAGFGIANPVMVFLSGGQGTSAPVGNPSTVAEFLSGNWLGWMAIVLLVIWGLIKFYIRSEDLEKRCSLLRSCKQQCMQIEYQLLQVLATETPMEKLPTLQAKLYELVDRNIAERSWQFSGPEPGIENEVDAYCNQLISKYSSFWLPAPSVDRD
ncbi:hypothetical protein [Nitrosomonas sp. Nm34]|uniref:hypothetical protein n=1 Tax=Nitrosomonas sp. Nm34 TaxID=1881055 RepID=UPI0008F4329A|nr:hypothetical protein [Nitrosomonas sp. Nm34]SFI70934.1 hypothetical protein SAMN05428978_102835 [Nitrosomonas sp. Nm34]